MLCVSLKNYVRACSGVNGGISDIAIFDSSDFNFSQATIAGVKQPYSAVTRRTGADGTGNTAAEATVTITAIGSNGDVITIKYNGVTLGTFAKTASETTTTLLAAALVADINDKTDDTGFSAANTGAAITITAPEGYGDTINAQNVDVMDGGGITATQAAFADGVTGTGYGKFFLINFTQDEGEWTYKQTVKGCAVKYEHEFIFQLPDNSQELTNFFESIDGASCCCGIGVIIRLNSGKIFVAGEKYVNGSSITRFTIKNDGTDGGSGKLMDDLNVGNMHLKGSYTRNLYEYSGTWESIEALMV